MANPEQLEILKRGVKVWNDWRKNNPYQKVNLSETDLSETDLSGVNLSGANLTRADLLSTKLVKANLSEAFLENTVLTFANLSSANLINAKLSRTNLRGAKLNSANLSGGKLFNTELDWSILNSTNFSKADFTDVDFIGADLSHANFSDSKIMTSNFNQTKLYQTKMFNCNMAGTVIALTELSTCKGLKTVTFSSECSIDFQTLKASKNLPKEFLLKIGLPENYIDYLPDFYDETPLRLFPVFLSHSWEDKPFVRKLYEALIQKGVKVFLDEKKMKMGDNIYDAISRNIDFYDKMILVCSESSLDSWWVDKELNEIFNKERKYRKEKGDKMDLMIPIRLDNAIFEWSDGKANDIKQRVIGDFSEWKDEAKFEKALNELVTVLNVDRNDRDIPSFLNLK